MKASFKYKISRRKIEAFTAKLDDLRSTLLLATTLGLRKSGNSNHEEILAHLKELQNDGQKAEILQTTRLLTDAIRKKAEPKLDKVRQQVDECLRRIDHLRQELPHICTREKAILNWLNFRQMTWRYEEVPLAYQQTYRWIFQPPSSDLSWDDFAAHLSEDVDAPYFVNGKAGSGKSTLLKYIVEHPDTQKLASKWAGPNHSLLMLNFFFWHQGTPLQKALGGMLRAIIHSALNSYPELIPVVFPDQYQAWSGDDIEDEPTYTELKRAFDILIVNSTKFLKICLFVDGIDEFEGDHRAVSEWLCSLVKRHKHVKAIVSSRPLNACLNTFRDCPTLKLQDLTKHDMELFIKGNLDSHPDMSRLTKRFPQKARGLVTEIQDKAQGVFLWVRIAVRLLVDGLEAGDDFRDLQNKLRSLPPDLRDLYQRMFSKMIPEYRVQAAEIFQLIHTWKSASSDPFTTTALFFALKKPLDALRLVNEPVDLDTLKSFFDSTEARIRSRCCGLLEVHRKHDSQLPGQISTDPNTGEGNLKSIEYLHRTVAEFLIEPEIWNELRALTAPYLNPTINLSSACLSLTKLGGHCQTTYDNMTALLRKQPQLSSDRIKEYLHAFDSVVTRYRSGDAKFGMALATHWSAAVYPLHGSLYNNQGADSWQVSTTTFTLAARQGFAQYLKASYGHYYVNRASAVFYALHTWLILPSHPIQTQISMQNRRETLVFLLEEERKLKENPQVSKIIDNARSVVQKDLARQLDLHDDGIENYALLVAIFVTTSRAPEEFILHYRDSGGISRKYPETLLYESEHDGIPGAQFFREIALILQRSDDADNKTLGQQMALFVEKIYAIHGLTNHIFQLYSEQHERTFRARSRKVPKAEEIRHRFANAVDPDLKGIDRLIEIGVALLVEKGRLEKCTTQDDPALQYILKRVTQVGKEMKALVYQHGAHTEQFTSRNSSQGGSQKTRSSEYSGGDIEDGGAVEDDDKDDSEWVMV